MKRFSVRRPLLAVVATQTILVSCANFDSKGVATGGGTITDAAIEPQGTVSFRVLHKADYNIDDRPTVRDFLVLSDAKVYASELKNYSIEFPAEIDFTGDSVVVATMGTQASGGYVISAISAVEYADRVVMQYELVSPADNCLTTEAESNPYEFVVVATRKPIEFNDVSRVEMCE